MTYELCCAICGNRFKAAQSSTRYCGEKCRQISLWRRRDGYAIASLSEGSAPGPTYPEPDYLAAIPPRKDVSAQGVPGNCLACDHYQHGDCKVYRVPHVACLTYRLEKVPTWRRLKDSIPLERALKR